MSITLTSHEKPGDLDHLLETLVQAHGYPEVLDHLVQVAERLNRAMPSATYLVTLTPEEREPFLKAAVDDALPLYEADFAKPEADRVLTADFASDFLEEFPEDEKAGDKNAGDETGHV